MLAVCEGVQDYGIAAAVRCVFWAFPWRYSPNERFDA